jgi:hypothetical protein
MGNRLMARRGAPAVDPARGLAAVAAARRDLELGNWARAAWLLDSAPAKDPNDRFELTQLLSRWSGRPVWLDRWPAAEPASPLPLLVRGAHATWWAWEARGGGTADTVSDDAARAFLERLRLAEADLGRAAQLDGRDPTPWALSIPSGMGLGEGLEALGARFEAAVARAPGHMGAHRHLLLALTGKWGGDDEMMLGFARRAATGAPPGSQLPLLSLAAHVEMAVGFGMREQAGAAVDHLRRPDVAAEVRAAMAHSLLHPAYRQGPHTPLDRNLAAFWLIELGDREGARAQFELLGDVVTDAPWQYFDEPGPMFAEYRAAASGRLAMPKPLTGEQVELDVQYDRFDTLDRATKREVERLAHEGRLHPDPAVAAASVGWARSTARRRRIEVGGVLLAAALAVAVSLAIGRPVLLGAPAMATVFAIKRLRFSHRLARLADQASRGQGHGSGPGHVPGRADGGWAQ